MMKGLIQEGLVVTKATHQSSKCKDKIILIIIWFQFLKFHVLTNNRNRNSSPFIFRELEMEMNLPARNSETEVLAKKPRSTESEDNQPIRLGNLDKNKDEQEQKSNEDNENPPEHSELPENTVKVLPKPLPPAEMFEIKNDPPISPFAGNKKLKRLMEKNKKYV